MSKIEIYNDSNYEMLLAPRYTEDGGPEALPRQTWYGSGEAAMAGLVPVADYPDRVVAWSDLKELIARCHEDQTFAVYHQLQKDVFSQGWSQNGLPYCWAWGATAALMVCRAAEGKPHVLLAPVSLGWLVGWKSQGYFLDATIKGMRERGVCPASCVPSPFNRSPRSYREGWEEEARDYRAMEWWDTDRRVGTREFICQCASVLATGRPGYVAYNWWGHALQVCGMEWDEREKNNVVWVLRNSHGERDVIRLAGDRGVPDELYCLRATA